MGKSITDGDAYVRGHLNALTMTLPDGTVTNAMVNGSAAIAASKLEHRHVLKYSQEEDTTIASEKHGLFICRGATGENVELEACITGTACIGAATVSIEVKKNGTTILSAPLVINAGDAVGDIKTATISVSALADDDRLTIEVTATAGGGTVGKGLLVCMHVNEDAV